MELHSNHPDTLSVLENAKRCAQHPHIIAFVYCRYKCFDNAQIRPCNHQESFEECTGQEISSAPDSESRLGLLIHDTVASEVQHDHGWHDEFLVGAADNLKLQVKVKTAQAEIVVHAGPDCNMDLAAFRNEIRGTFIQIRLCVWHLAIKTTP